MEPKKLTDVFGKRELDFLNEKIKMIVDPINDMGEYIYDDQTTDEVSTVSRSLGRIQSRSLWSNESSIIDMALLEMISLVTDQELKTSSITYVEYNKKYGTPALPPHYDGDSSEFIINFQIESNTSWQLGIGTKLYDMEDNSALIFDGNEHVHWRPHKNFKDGEYVRMIFFRFMDENNVKDNSDKRLSLNSPVFKEANKFRDSLTL